MNKVLKTAGRKIDHKQEWEFLKELMPFFTLFLEDKFYICSMQCFQLFFCYRSRKCLYLLTKAEWSWRMKNSFISNSFKRG